MFRFAAVSETTHARLCFVSMLAVFAVTLALSAPAPDLETEKGPVLRLFSAENPGAWFSAGVVAELIFDESVAALHVSRKAPPRFWPVLRRLKELGCLRHAKAQYFVALYFAALYCCGAFFAAGFVASRELAVARIRAARQTVCGRSRDITTMADLENNEELRHFVGVPPREKEK